MTDDALEMEFVRRSQKRFVAGVHEYRDGDFDAPFAGDPVDEAIDEVLDLRNYALEAFRAGRISATNYDRLRVIAGEAFAILRRGSL